uniref:Uncharacterized protein n=1 Tax=Vespula pensylvanica TaxID=30213 RepID=A0A834K0K8_VESPE|nr:hypothetical protein H0235_016162 [Vespula pensylvanica]
MFEDKERPFCGKISCVTYSMKINSIHVTVIFWFAEYLLPFIRTNWPFAKEDVSRIKPNEHPLKMITISSSVSKRSEDEECPSVDPFSHQKSSRYSSLVAVGL